MTAQQDLDDLQQDSWEQVIHDHSAKLMALAHLCVEKELFTENEFLQAQVRAARMVEEEKTKRMDQFKQISDAADYERMKELHGLLISAMLPYDEHATIDMFRAETGDMEGCFGTIAVRVVSKAFHGLDHDSRGRLLHLQVSPFLARHTERVCFILLTPDERPHSAANLQFEGMIEAQGLTSEEDRHASEL